MLLFFIPEFCLQAFRFRIFSSNNFYQHECIPRAKNRTQLVLVKCIDDSSSPYWQDSQMTTFRDTLSQHESKSEPTTQPPAEITVFLLGPGSDPCPPQRIHESELVCVNWTFSSHWSPTYKHIIRWNWTNEWNASRNICLSESSTNRPAVFNPQRCLFCCKPQDQPVPVWTAAERPPFEMTKIFTKTRFCSQNKALKNHYTGNSTDLFQLILSEHISEVWTDCKTEHRENHLLWSRSPLGHTNLRKHITEESFCCCGY